MRLQPFLDALRGLAFLVRTQRNARVHAFFTVAVIIVGSVLRIGLHDACWLVVATAMVWTAEALNTAIERLADRVTTDRDPLIRQAKDVAAGAVLIATIAAVIIGVLILGPPLWRWVRLL